MALNLLDSPKWSAYESAVNLKPQQFVQAARLYALLHDVGHLPLSHLFEFAFEDWAEDREDLKEVCNSWFGYRFRKLHEACGAAITKKILDDLKIAEPIYSVIVRLTASKRLGKADPLRPIKLLVDSEVDADRIDATARDGLLAGGEYGTYDIERLCSAVSLQQDGPQWRLAYSIKALGSIEALLLDRYRTHTWIHFHHQVVAMKVAVSEIIGKLLSKGAIQKDSFPVNETDQMGLRDDIWLWSMIRTLEPDDSYTKQLLDYILYREKKGMILLWKDRAQYSDCRSKLLEATQLRDLDELPRLDRRYEQFLTDKLGRRSLVFWIDFEPVGGDAVPLASEDGQKKLGDIVPASPLLQSLKAVWGGEPRFYIVCLGGSPVSGDDLRTQWIEASKEWVDMHSH